MLALGATGAIPFQFFNRFFIHKNTGRSSTLILTVFPFAGAVPRLTCYVLQKAWPSPHPWKITFVLLSIGPNGSVLVEGPTLSGDFVIGLGFPCAEFGVFFFTGGGHGRALRSVFDDNGISKPQIFLPRCGFWYQSPYSDWG